MTIPPPPEPKGPSDPRERCLAPVVAHSNEIEVPAGLALFALGIALLPAASPLEDLDPAFASWAVAAGLALLAVATTMLELVERRNAPRQHRAQGSSNP